MIAGRYKVYWSSDSFGPTCRSDDLLSARRYVGAENRLHIARSGNQLRSENTPAGKSLLTGSLQRGRLFVE